LPNDIFIGKITLFADNYGQLPLMEFEFKGSLKWGEKHPIADGAWKIDYAFIPQGGATPDCHWDRLDVRTSYPACPAKSGGGSWYNDSLAYFVVIVFKGHIATLAQSFFGHGHTHNRTT